MSNVAGSPALRLLLRLKLRGAVRRQWRRLRTPKGVALTLIGFVTLGAWFGYLAFSVSREPPQAPETAELRVRIAGLGLFLLSLTSALTNRGLYLPKSEVERLFSAPVSRADLVRYRLLANGLRSLLGGLLLGLFGAGRMPEPALAFVGIVLAMQTLPAVNQIVAIALGGLERRAAHALKRVAQVLVTLLLVGLGLLAFTLASGRSLESVPLLGGWLAGALSGTRNPLSNPALFTLVTAPFVPWARMIAASTPGEFAPWLCLCLALHVLAIELCARVPIDFREASLQTSVRIASRIARLQRGGGVAATRASKSAAGWRIPWLFGRSPVGAIAWRKSAGMARKAQGALWVALIALLFITIFAIVLVDGQPEEEALYTSGLIALLGTVYLCSGLRFDFREELERMDVIRAWPLDPARVFVAMLLPEVVLVSMLVAGTVLVEAMLSRGVTEFSLFVVVSVPFVVFTWVALDNLVFLFAPVRLVPGQDGFVQNAGRRSLQALLLFGSVVSVGGCAVLAFYGAFLAATALGVPEEIARAFGFVALIGTLVAGDALLVLLGAALLRRFDVSRDRG